MGETPLSEENSWVSPILNQNTASSLYTIEISQRRIISGISRFSKLQRRRWLSQIFNNDAGIGRLGVYLRFCIAEVY